MKKVILSACLAQQLLSFTCYGMDGREILEQSQTEYAPPVHPQNRDPKQYMNKFQAKLDKCKQLKQRQTFFHLDASVELDCGDLRPNYGYSVPTEEALAKMTRFIGADSTLSVASGNGFIEGMLKNRGVDIVASDIKAPTHRYIDITEQDMTEAVQNNDHNVLMMACLFSKDNPQEFFKGNKIIHIGGEESLTGGLPNEDKWKQVFPRLDKDGYRDEDKICLPSVLDDPVSPLVELRLFERRPVKK